MGVGTVFLLYRSLHGPPVAVPALDDGEIAVATVLEDVGLYVVIALLGIVVQVAKALLRHVVVADIVLQGGTVLLQRVADVGGQRHTDVAVGFALVIQQGDGHRLQRGDERVVARYLRVGLVHEHLEGQLLATEVVILLGSLMAGVGQVEDIIQLL